MSIALPKTISMRPIELIRVLNTIAYFPGALGARALSQTTRGRELVDVLADRFSWYRLIAGPLAVAIGAALAVMSPYWVMHVPFLAYLSFTAPARAAQVAVAHTPGWLLLTLPAFLVECILIVRDAHESGDGQRRIAGKWAESSVRRVVRQIAKQVQGQDLHNVLLVVNRGQQNEFSMEIDHLLVTRHKVFVIETKYQAGRVLVDEHASEWRVEGGPRSSSMRNALLQAKNTCTQLQRHFNIGATPIPVVVITSTRGTAVVSPVSNVVTPDELPAVVAALDKSTSTGALDTGALLNRIVAASDRSVHARRAHNARAQAARQRRADENIRGRASL